MASKTTIFLAIFLLLNIISVTLVNACDDHDDKPNPPKASPKPKPPKPAPAPKAPKPASVPKPAAPAPKPAPKPESPKPAPKSKATCPKDTLKLNLCVNVLDIIKIGPTKQCCSLLDGLADLDAALCLCSAIKANVLNLIHLIVPVDLTLYLNQCGRTCTEKYQCRA